MNIFLCDYLNLTFLLFPYLLIWDEYKNSCVKNF